MGKKSKPDAKSHAGKAPRMNKKLYEQELFRLQAELVEMQEWV